MEKKNAKGESETKEGRKKKPGLSKCSTRIAQPLGLSNNEQGAPVISCCLWVQHPSLLCSPAGEDKQVSRWWTQQGASHLEWWEGTFKLDASNGFVEREKLFIQTVLMTKFTSSAPQVLLWPVKWIKDFIYSQTAECWSHVISFQVIGSQVMQSHKLTCGLHVIQECDPNLTTLQWSRCESASATSWTDRWLQPPLGVQSSFTEDTAAMNALENRNTLLPEVLRLN